MKVLIRGWSARNLRGGLRNLDIDLGESPTRWTLIQMANGMGKTTTMRLLRAAFTDEAIPPSQVQELRGSDEETEGSFEVRLLIDGKPYRLGFDFDFRDGVARRYTVRAGTRDGGRVDGRALPSELADLLSPQLTEMFVFNGELAKDIRDMKKKTADDAIRALYRLGQVTGLVATVDTLVDIEQRRAAAMTSASEERGVTRLRNLRDEAARMKTKLAGEVANATDRAGRFRAEVARLSAAIQERMSEDAGLRERLENLNERQRTLTAETHQLSGEALNILRRPPHVHPRLLQRLHFLGGRLFELKLPETISAEFFRDLAAKPSCVCGRPIGHDQQEHILKSAHQYLAQDQISIINQMKLALRESAGDPDQFASKVRELGLKLIERQRLKSERDRLEMERIASGDDALERLRAELDTNRSELDRLESQLERLTTRDPHRHKSLRLTWETNLPLCEARFVDAEDRHSVATNTQTFKRKANALKALIVDFEQRALARLRERVRLRTNEKLLQIAKTEVLEVTRIAGGLEIASPGLRAKADISEGQSLSVAYAFLTSLLSDAPYRLPFVVDSPAVSLDSVNRREVGELIPDFFDQMIMFVISTEREGFAESFYTRGDEVRYLTVSRTDGQIRVDPGLEIFRSFQDRDAA